MPKHQAARAAKTTNSSPVQHGTSASIAPEKLKSRDIRDYMELVETVARVEYSRLPNHLIDYPELVNLGALTLHLLFEKNPEKDYNVTYLSTAMKWAVRNELRYRYKWYSLRNTDADVASDDDEVELNDDFGPERGQAREAVYSNILSVDGLMEADNPHELRDESQTPDETSESNELGAMVRTLMNHLPERDKQLLEARFFQNKRMREIGQEFGISPSRASRVVQSAMEKIKKEVLKSGLVLEF